MYTCNQTTSTLLFSFIFIGLSLKRLPCWMLLLLITLPLSLFSIILYFFMFNSSVSSYVYAPALSLDERPILAQFHVFTLASGSHSVDIVQEVTSECDKLGILLGLPHSLVTNTMSGKAYGNLEDKCRSIINKWLIGQGTVPVTWRAFIGVLKEMKYLLADDLLKELSKTSR